MKGIHVSVCVCTYQRPFYLNRLLDRLEQQQTGGKFTFDILVVDNDEYQSADIVVEYFIRRMTVATFYFHEPERNIARARNKAVLHAIGELIAFIDDDEFPEKDWLLRLVSTLEDSHASGVLGPVRPHFDQRPPQWILRGRFCERPEHPTGTVLDPGRCRTGNLLFRRDILGCSPEPFDPQFALGGEDVDFFIRMNRKGCTFIWCNEAVVYEAVPPSRWNRSYMFRRALLRGENVMKRRKGRARLVAKSFLAIPFYLLILPGALLSGQHVFVKYGIKFCDHFGRILALLGLHPIQERQM